MSRQRCRWVAGVVPKGTKYVDQRVLCYVNVVALPIPKLGSDSDLIGELAKVIERHVERVVVLRRFTGMFGALRGRSSPQGAKVTGLLVTFHARPDRHTRAATSTRLRASQRVEMLARWVLTVLSDKNNWSAISLLVSPCATN